MYPVIRSNCFHLFFVGLFVTRSAPSPSPLLQTRIAPQPRAGLFILFFFILFFVLFFFFFIVIFILFLFFFFLYFRQPTRRFQFKPFF